MRYVGLEPLLTAVNGVQTFSRAEMTVTKGAIQDQAFVTSPRPPLPGYTGWNWYGDIFYDSGFQPHDCAEEATYGTGCVGSGGLNVLAASSRPVLGTIFQATVTGLPSWNLALALLGLAPMSLPLASLVPQGGPGCNLLVTPDLTALLWSTTGTAQLTFAIPNSPALVGFPFYQQVVALELDPAANLIALTSSNGLALTIGSY